MWQGACWPVQLLPLCVAYANNMLLIANKNQVMLQTLLDLANKLASQIGLIFNLNKCVNLHYSCTCRAGARGTLFNLNGSTIPHLSDGEPHSFLGRPIWSFLPKDIDSLEGLKFFANKILNSKLAPWQRLNCLWTFFFPSLLFNLRMGIFGKKDWLAINNSLKPLIKKTLNLPGNAVN